jgi:hypothetical protein
MINLQGDCGIEWVEELPEGAILLKHKTLLTGEGKNSHVAVCEKPDDVLLYEKDGVIYFKAKADFEIRHETHYSQTIKIDKPKIGKIQQPLELDPFADEIRKQQD